MFVCEGGAQLQWAVTVLDEHVSVSERINVRESVFERLCVWEGLGVNVCLKMRGVPEEVNASASRSA